MSVLSCSLMVRESSSVVPLLVVPGSPFLQELPERGWVSLLGSISFSQGQSPGMVLGPVCSAATREAISVSEDKTKSFGLSFRNGFFGEDSGYILSIGFWGGGNQVVASGLDCLT